jgi:hypothetical protein
MARRRSSPTDYPFDELRDMHELLRRIDRQMDRFEAILKAWGMSGEAEPKEPTRH